MEPPVRTREQHSQVEQEFLAVCRQFLLHAIPVDVMPPGRTVQYKSKKFINHTDYWLTLPRILSHSGNCLTRTEQSRHIRDRTGEMMRTVPKMLSLLESLLVSSWDLGRECESREQTVTSVLKEYLEEQCVGVRVRDRFPEVTWMHEYPSQLDTRKMHDLYTCMRQAQDHIACMKTFEDGFKICMICGYDFWSAIWEDRIPAVLGKFASPALTGRIDTAHLLFFYGVDDDSLREFYEIPPYASGWVVEDEQCTQGPLNICRCVKCTCEAWRLFSKGLERDIKSTKHPQSLHV